MKSSQKVCMKNIFSRKKPNRFIELLVAQAEYTFDGWQVLLAYMRDPKEEPARQV